MTARRTLVLALALCATLGGAGCGQTVVKFVLGSPPAPEDRSGGILTNRTHYQRNEVTYEVGALGESWKLLPDPKGDMEFFSSALGAAIALRSSCARYSDAPMPRLARDLLIGVTERKITREEYVPFGGREALDLEATGRLDGVPVHMWVRVLRTSRCIFDYTLVAPPERFDKARPDFQAFLDGFKILEQKR